MSDPYQGIFADFSKLEEGERKLARKALVVIAACEEAIPSLYKLEDPSPIAAALDAALDLVDAIGYRLKRRAEELRGSL